VNWLFAFLTWLWAGITQVAQHVRSLWTPARQPFRLERGEDLPGLYKAQRVYVAGEGENAWAAGLLCPCGCNEVIELNLIQSVRPNWQVWEDADGTANLSPSVWRQKGCRSHFFLRSGRIDWC
jgi:hypothetical protein